MDIPIQIANSTSSVIVRAEDPWNILAIATMLLACATIILVIVTFFGNRWTNKNTQTSNRMLELELRSRIRPTLQLEFRKINPSHIQKEGKSYVDVKGEIGNLGNVPVRNIRFYFNYGNKKPENLAEILKNEDYWRKRGIDSHFGTIVPNTTNSYRPFSTGEFQYDESDVNPLWFVAWIEYEFLDMFKESCIFIFRVINDWVDQDDILFYSNSDIEEEKHN